jgi:hypothetical protein
MARQILPSELVERIVTSFEKYLPDGVFMTLRDGSLDVRSVDGGGWFGERLGVLPWPPMPADTKWRLAVQSVYETIARGIGACVSPPTRSTAREGDPFEIRWPAPGCAVDVSISDGLVDVDYVDTSGQAVLSMPQIQWRGPRTQPGDRRASREGGNVRGPLRYIGEVPDEVRERDSASEEQDRTRDAARHAIIDEVKRSEPGTDKAKIRAAFRAAFANHPDGTNPEPGSVAEDRMVDAYAAVHGYAAAPGPAAALQLAVVAGKHLWDIARILRGTHPDLSDTDENEDS